MAVVVLHVVMVSVAVIVLQIVMSPVAVSAPRTRRRSRIIVKERMPVTVRAGKENDGK